MGSKVFTVFILFLSFNLNTFAFNLINQNDTTAASVKNSKRIYNTIRLSTEKPRIDGILDDPCWETGTWAGDFIQWIPNEGAEPSQPTEIKILYDDNNIYVAIRAYDNEPDKIADKAGRRDEFQGDIVGINFDSYHDRRTGFEFDVTAAGQKIDLILTNPSIPDMNWNAVWYGKTAREDSAWTVEMEIPLSQLRYSTDYEQVWGMHCWRWIDRFQEESDWEPQSSKGPGSLYLFGELHGIKGLPRSRRIEIMPYSVGKLNTFEKEIGNPFADKGKTWLGNFGFDAKIGLSSNFTADLTINPDFGQVESDPSVMNLTAFETFYEEKRPFFLEGKNIFGFDLNDASIFYSRRIGHSPSYTPDLKNNEYIDSPDNTTILSAVKISGKTSSGLSVGVLQSLTAGEKADLSLNGNLNKIRVEPLTNYGIVRIQKDYNAGNTMLGGIITSTNRFINDSHLNFMNKNAFTGGLDLHHFWNDKEFYVDAKVIGSSISGSTNAIKELQYSSARYYQRPDAYNFDSTRTHLSGHGGAIKIGKGSKGLWRYSTAVSWRSPGLDLNDLGYMQIADIFKQENAVSYFVNQPVSIFRTYSIGFEQSNDWDYKMDYLSSGAELNIYLEFNNLWAVSNSIEYQTQTLATRILRGGYATLIPAVWSNDFYFRTDPTRKISFALNGSMALSQNQNSRFYGIQPEIYFLPLNNLKFSVSAHYSSNVDNLQYVDTKTVNAKDKYILGKLNQHTLALTFRVDYNISPELSIQYYGSPFASTGKFSEFKTIIDPRAADYNNRFMIINPDFNGVDYQVSESGGIVNYSFGNPDFNFSQFRSNLVLRWEYRPGSQIYLVWANEMTYDVKPGYNSLNQTMNMLRSAFPNNIFLVKVNYWFTI
ncbi:MAG: DUF5916 domain-containing protein [Ignavibacteriaceae bacterium]